MKKARRHHSIIVHASAQHKCHRRAVIEFAEANGRPRGAPVRDYFLRWRIFARMRRFLRPSFRRPLPDFFVPKAFSAFYVARV